MFGSRSTRWPNIIIDYIKYRKFKWRRRNIIIVLVLQCLLQQNEHRFCLIVLFYDERGRGTDVQSGQHCPGLMTPTQAGQNSWSHRKLPLSQKHMVHGSLTLGNILSPKTTKHIQNIKCRNTYKIRSKAISIDNTRNQ